MPTLLTIGLTNAFVVIVLGLVIFVITRLWRNPYAARFLWLLVLVKFVTPPIFEIPIFQSDALESSSNVTDVIHGQFSGMPGVPDFSQSTQGDDDTIENCVDDTGALAEPLRAESSVDSRVPLSVIGMSIWGSGSVIWLFITFRRIARFDRIVRRSAFVDDSLQRRIKSLAHRLGLSRYPQGRLTEASIAPLIWFTRPQPILLLPVGLLNNLSEPQAETVLVHELFHLKRHDHLVRWFELVVIVLFWWHPVLWWVIRKLHLAEEECCDASVLHFFPDKTVLYGETLFKAAEFLNRQSFPPATAIALGQSHQLKRRLTMILDNRPPLRISLVKRVALLLFAVVVLPLSARAFPEKDADTKTSATGTELRWNLTEGETLRYSLQIRQNGGISVFPVQEVQNPQHKHSASQQIDMEWRIQETNPDGSTIVSMRIPRFILNRKTAFANQNIQYDSKLNKTEDENLRKVSRTVLESEYRFIVNSQGKIKKLTLSENLLEILKNTKVIRDKPYSFFTAFHAEHLERELNAVLFSHPAKTVSKGATWSKTEKWPLANVMVVSNNRHLYHGPTDENLHKIELTANIKTHPMFDEEDDPNKNIKIVFKNGENKGTVLFDNHSGRIRESRYQQSFSWISKPQLSDVQIEKLSKADADKVREARIIQTLTTKTTLRLQPAGN